MFLGRDTPGKEQRARRVREWIVQRPPAALAAGGLGVIAPIDGIFVLPAVAAIGCGVIGLWRLRSRPTLLGHRLCVLGIVGGVVGLSVATFLHFWSGPDVAEASRPMVSPTASVESDRR